MGKVTRQPAYHAKFTIFCLAEAGASGMVGARAVPPKMKQELANYWIPKPLLYIAANQTPTPTRIYLVIYDAVEGCLATRFLFLLEYTGKAHTAFNKEMLHTESTTDNNCLPQVETPATWHSIFPPYFLTVSPLRHTKSSATWLRID